VDGQVLGPRETGKASDLGRVARLDRKLDLVEPRPGELLGKGRDDRALLDGRSTGWPP